MDDGQKVITTAHPEHSSGELKMTLTGNICVAEWQALLTLNHKSLDTSPTGGGIRFVTEWSFAQSIITSILWS